MPIILRPARHDDLAPAQELVVGPVAVNQPALLFPALETALGLAIEGGAPQVSALLPGSSDAALTAALQHGMRIAFPMVLACTSGFGDWQQYLPRNPGFM
jgi:hypothetical protein